MRTTTTKNDDDDDDDDKEDDYYDLQKASKLISLAYLSRP